MELRSWEGRNGRELLAGAVLSAIGAGSLSGCSFYEEDCHETKMCLAPPASLCDGDPATAPAVDGCGVFVSTSAAASDRNPGTRRRPFRTLQHAVDVAAQGVNRVYACAHRFEEEVTLTSGVDLWAGRDCEGGDWSVRWPAQLTTLAPGPVGVPLRVVEGKEAPESTIFGVQIVAADASASDGKSSIAVILSYGARAYLRSSEVIAGNGKDGEPGEDAPSSRAKDGILGNDGADACTADLVPGAAAVVTRCDDGIESTGGSGGEGEPERGGDGAPGKPDSNETSSTSGSGGIGGDGTTLCSPGEPGADGTSRGRSAGVSGVGSLSDHGWRGLNGRDGERGGVGHGGGGGGGIQATVEMNNVCRMGLPQGGPAGGSGGSGGCGGRGGKGGGYGGASIAIIALEHTELTVEATEITTGKGGKGGVGGTGQLGGKGNVGGYGGHLPILGMGEGCDGGHGGNGGSGGDAGGGLGGASIGVAFVEPNMALRPGTNFSIGQRGDGGLAGNASDGDEVGKGAEGPSSFWFLFGAEIDSPR